MPAAAVAEAIERSMPAEMTTNVAPDREHEDDAVRLRDVREVVPRQEHVLGDREVDAEQDERHEDAGVASHRQAAGPRGAPETATWATCSAASPAAANSPRTSPRKKTRMRSAIPSSSGSSDEMTMIAAPRLGALLHQAVDLALGADVDPARRLREHEHLEIAVEDPPEDDLLLVAARERGDAHLRGRGDHVVALDRRADAPALRARVQHAGARELARPRDGEVLGHAARGQQRGTACDRPARGRSRWRARSAGARGRRAGRGRARCPRSGSPRRAPGRARPCPSRPARRRRRSRRGGRSASWAPAGRRASAAPRPRGPSRRARSLRLR